MKYTLSAKGQIQIPGLDYSQMHWSATVENDELDAAKKDLAKAMEAARDVSREEVAIPAKGGKPKK